ncbi:MAG TPA: hypothetical protein VGA52_05685 [Anaerolineales bacterium]
MNASVFLSNSYDGRSGLGMVRAERGSAGTWTSQFVMEQADVRCLARAGGSSPIAYAGTDGNGVLRSDDRGVSWRMSGLAGVRLRSMAISPHDPQIVFAGSLSALLYRSDDGGSSWREVSSFRRIPNRWWWLSPAEWPPKPSVYAIAFSPTDPQVVLAGIEFGAVVRSQDGGETWSGHRSGAIRDCHALAFNTLDGSWAYQAGAGRAAGAVSRDGGEKWRQLTDGLDRSYGWACASDPERPEIWYLSASTGPGDAHSWDHANAHIYRSVGGAGWEKLAGGLPQPCDHLPTSLLVEPGQSGHLYAGLTNGTIWFSSDHGDQWERLPVDLKGIWHQLVMWV